GPRWCSPRSKTSLPAAGCRSLETAAQKQIEGRNPALIVARGQVDRPDVGVGTEEQRRVATRRADAQIAPCRPDVAQLEGQSGIGRHVEDALATASHAAKIQRTRDRIVWPGER